MITSIVLILIIFSHIGENDTFKIQPRIVGGYKASSGQFPYYAFFEIENGVPNKFNACGGALISHDWIITAAHCLIDRKKLRLHLGKTVLNKAEDGHAYFDVEEKDFFIYPIYTKEASLHDIALVRLPQKIKFSKYIQPVPLPKVCKSTEGIDSLVMGNGATSNSNSLLDPELSFAFLTTISPSECEKTFPGISFLKSIICAQNAVNGQSICKGDSGGPLITRSDGILIGVSSFVHKDGCEDGKAQGFTSIYPYLGWIRDHTRLNIAFDC